ncbi:MAG: hypothetical protein N2559_00450 [Anaerolineae bacterium]|nr:hypothetical protein [Anaerolineae bacterium]
MEPPRTNWWLALVIVLRVMIFLGVWLVLFMGIFLGYFTVPLIVLAALTLFYAITDAGLVIALVRQRARQARHTFLQARDSESTQNT